MGGIYARAAFKIASWNGGMGLKIFFLFLGRGVRGDGREAPRLIPRQAGKILKYRCPQRASARIWGPIWSHLPLKAFPSKKANSNDAWCVFHQKFIIFVLEVEELKVHFTLSCLILTTFYTEITKMTDLTLRYGNFFSTSYLDMMGGVFWKWKIQKLMTPKVFST